MMDLAATRSKLSSWAGTKIGLIHSSGVLVPLFDALCHELLPNVQIVNIADDRLIADAIALGAMSSSVSKRLQDHILDAQAAGVDAIVVTCSSLGPAVEASQNLVRIPLIRVDQAMADAAVALASRIGIIATVSTTLGPTAELIERRAQEAGKSIQVTVSLCDGALEQLLTGDIELHDKLVTEKLLELIPQVDVVVLAQASMTRVIDLLLPEHCTILILSSPRLAIEALAKQIRQSE